MKKVLFLDDDSERHMIFKSQMGKTMATGPFDVHTVWTAREAIDALKKNSPYDIVFLDHDLGGMTFVESGPGSGYEVACHIETMEETHLPKRVVVHSWNPEGSKKMLRAIQTRGLRGYYSPFGEQFYDALFYHLTGSF